jgi:hypothetical protein
VDQAEKLFTKFQDKGFRDRCVSWTREIIDMARVAYSGGAEKFEELKGDWENSVRLEFCLGHQKPVDLFSELFAGIPQPHIVTVEEIADVLANELAASGPAGDAEHVYNRFIDHVRSDLLAKRRSERFDLCELSELPGWDAIVREVLAVLGTDAEGLGTNAEGVLCGHLPDDELEGLKLWTGDATELRIVGIRPSSCRSTSSPGLPIARTVTLVVELTGQVSQGAIERLADELIPVLCSLVTSAALICQGCKPSYPSLPGMKPNDLRRHLPFVQGCAKVVFLEDTEDTTARRLCNAVRLLGQADQQSVMALKLALSVAAIEALLGEKGSELAGRLSTYVARLLEPKPAFRTKAQDFVRDLYDERSKALHGAALDSDEKVADARKLAAGCLYAVWFRDDFCHRFEDRSDKPAALLKELESSQYTEGLLDGVPDVAAVRRLWGAA